MDGRFSDASLVTRDRDASTPERRRVLSLSWFTKNRHRRRRASPTATLHAGERSRSLDRSVGRSSERASRQAVFYSAQVGRSLLLCTGPGHVGQVHSRVLLACFLLFIPEREKLLRARLLKLCHARDLIARSYARRFDSIRFCNQTDCVCHYAQFEGAEIIGGTTFRVIYNLPGVV